MGFRYGFLVWNTAPKQIPGDVLAALELELDPRFPAPFPHAGFTGKAEDNEIGIGSAHGWTVLLGQYDLGTGSEGRPRELLPGLSQTSKAVFFCCEGTSGYVQLEVWENAKRLRAYEKIDGTTTVAVGAPPIPNAHGEIDVWEVVHAAAAESIPWEAMSGCDFVWYHTRPPAQ